MYINQILLLKQNVLLRQQNILSGQQKKFCWINFFLSVRMRADLPHLELENISKMALLLV